MITAEELGPVTSLSATICQALPVLGRRGLVIGDGSVQLAALANLRLPQLAFWVVQTGKDYPQLASGWYEHVLNGSIEDASVREALHDKQFDCIILNQGFEVIANLLETLQWLASLTGTDGILIAPIPDRSAWLGVMDALRNAGIMPSDADDEFFRISWLEELLRKTGWKYGRIIEQRKAKDRPKKQGYLQTDLGALLVLHCGGASLEEVPFEVVGLNCVDFVGIYEVRVDYPHRPISSIPGARFFPSPDPINWNVPGERVLIFYRAKRLKNKENINKLARSGVILIVDLDDDYFTEKTRNEKRHELEETRRVLRFFHACLVSTPELEQRLRPYHPVVRCFPNMVETVLPSMAPPAPPLRFFFGALNRGQDWEPFQPALAELCRRYGKKLAFYVLFDRAFFDALPTENKQFYPLVMRKDYLALLNNCHVSFMPLLNEGFNQAKSDLKLIETLAMGAVPICPPIIYGDHLYHRTCACFIENGDELVEVIGRILDEPGYFARLRDTGWDYVRTQRVTALQASDRLAWYKELRADHTRLEEERLSRVRIDYPELAIQNPFRDPQNS